MRGSLGEKIGEGAFADVHAWAPGQVVKLFKAGVPRRVSRWEARMTRAVFAAGGPAPEVLGEVTLEGRFGIVLPRLDGPTLLQLSRSGAMTHAQAGAIIASLCLSVHKTPPPPDVLLLARLDGRLVAALRRRSSGAHRHGHPRPDRAPAAGGRAVPYRPSPRQRDHDGGWSKTDRLGRCGPRTRRPRPCVLPRHPVRDRSGSRRQSAAAARRQCGRAVRIRAAGRHVASGADGGDGALFADRPRLRSSARGRCLPCGSG